MDKTDKAIADILAKLQQLADPHGAEAVQLAVKAAQIDAIQTIVVGFMGLGFAVLFLTTGPLAITRSVRLDDEGDEGRAIAFGVYGAASTVFGILATIGAVTGLGSVKAWVGMSDPKLYLAHRILDRVL